MIAPQSSEDASGSEGQPPAPRMLELARWLWIAAAVLELVRSLWQLADRERLIKDLHNAAPQLNQQQLDAAANNGVLITLLFAAAMIVVYAGLSTRMLQGRNWARVVLAVFGGFSVFGTLVTLLTLAVLGRAEVVRLVGADIAPLDIVFSVFVTLLHAGALVLMFLPDSNRFYQRGAPRPFPPMQGPPFVR